MANSSKRIQMLIIEDNHSLCESLKDELSTNYSVTIAATAIEGKNFAQQICPDLIVIDIHLPDICGIDLCKELRKNVLTQNVPILMISATNTLETRLDAFHAGADDFIEKPFIMEEFHARIYSKIRRLLDENPKIIECGNLVLNSDNYSVFVKNRLIPFTQLEFNILKFFISNKEKVVTRQKIAEEIWQEPIGNDRTVDTHLVAIRKKLNDFDHEISTIYGAGYLLRKKELIA